MTAMVGVLLASCLGVFAGEPESWEREASDAPGSFASERTRAGAESVKPGVGERVARTGAGGVRLGVVVRASRTSATLEHGSAESRKTWAGERPDAVGRLVPSSRLVSGGRTWALLDDAGGIEALVRVPAGLDPRRLEGRRVAVRGAGGYDEDQRLRVIRARQMAALPGARRALEVNARWWEGDRIVGR